ncbi:MAG: hypothetical protein ACREID_04400, partial [Planctomycetota bacterium]
MRRQLLLGRAGAGKTHVCLQRLRAALDAREAALLLVPTYSQAEHVRLLLLERAGGVSPRVVETFSSFAEARTGLRLRDLASPGTKDLVAEAALRVHFPAAEQPGFRAEFIAAVKEIKENGAPREEALAQARSHFPPGSRGRALFEAYASYGEALKSPDHEDLLA